MGDIYQVFNLPPPPPPTFLSFYNGPDRARLPNFLDSADPVGAAKEYLHGQIMFVCLHSIWTQVKIVTGLAGLILVIAMAVIVRRLVQRSLWFLRVKATERGPMIIPNAIMVFAATEGLFVIIFLALINKIYVAWVVEERPLKNLILWIVLTWSPLIAGPIWSSFGVWHARPPGSTPRSRDPPTLFGIRIWLPKSIFVSLFWLSVPFMVLFSVLGFGIKGNTSREQAVGLYYDWFDRYSNATTLTRPMLLELQDIWSRDLRAFYWLAIAMLVWFFWTVVLFLAYTYVSLRLLIPLRAQLAALRERNERRIIAMMADDASGKGVVGPEGHGTKSAGYFDAPKSQIESVQLPLETPRLRSLAANFVGGRMDNVEFEKADEEDGVDEHWGVNVKDLQVDAPHRSFFPPVKPSAVVRPATDSETSEKYLSAAYKHFLFQAVTVTVAIVYFSELTIYLALTVYSYNERRILGRAIDTAFLQAMWGAVLFGSCVFISITLRTYEPMLVSLLQNAHANSNGDRQSPSAQKASKMLKMLNLRHHDPKHSLSLSQGGTTLPASPSPTPKLPHMQPVHEASHASDQVRSQDSQTRSFRRSTILRSTHDSIPGPFNFSASDNSVTKPSPPRRTPVPDVYGLEEEDAKVAQPDSPHTRTTIGNQAGDDVQQPFFTYKSGLGFLESSSSLNDRSLREMPSMTNLQRYDSAFSQAEYAMAHNDSASVLPQPQSPTHAGRQQQQQQQQQQHHPERSSAESPSTSSSLEQRFNDDFVGGLRGASPTSDDERVRAFRAAFVRDMLSTPGGTPLPPPPRQARRPSKTSQSS
ncbi:hypothetical protein OC846_005180 [Tilletia horrida]|uniref:Uncharacterized protein n=1 Tax=Tilletia horrida TaxID=155126 RepID=A0AAN6GL07_9BASI|nr:hypothetical protein OC845_005691 [Tilletia horrida]KAK0546631.1 hypothetical protein OC846_005180 [Tilletia horrida]KAK0562458.1 hypothetical protein OC861_005299 [Tilletia horrida]